MVKKIILWALCGLTWQMTMAGHSPIDSLKQLLFADKEDTSKVRHLERLSWEYQTAGKYDSALHYGNASLRLSRKLKFTKGIGDAAYSIGSAYDYQGKYEEAIKYYSFALSIQEMRKDTDQLIVLHQYIGYACSTLRHYEKAIENYLLALQLSRAKGKKYEAAIVLFWIGILYEAVGNYPKALENYTQYLTTILSTENKSEIARAYCAAGWGCQLMNDYKKALEYQINSLKIYEETKDTSGNTAYPMGNLGLIYNNLGEYEKALEYSNRTIAIAGKIKDDRIISEAYNNIGNIYREMKQYSLSLQYLHRGLAIARKVNEKSEMRNSYQGLALTYEQLNDIGNAYTFQKLFIHLNDSLQNQEKAEQIQQMQTRYEIDKKEQEIQMLCRDKEIQQAQLNRQESVIWSAAGGLLFVISLVFFVYRGYKQQQKANTLLEHKNCQIEKQKRQIEEAHETVQKKNEEITDSITYASRIQRSMLIREEEAHKMMPFETFIFFRPKDIVSGDFYWFSRQQNKYLIAAVDCTGHGVPGGFLSMIGNGLLNEIVYVMKITSPAEMLNKLHQLLTYTLQQAKGSDMQDGMDIAICTLDMEKKTLEYAGAKNPLYLIRDNRIEIVKGDLVSIGGRRPLNVPASGFAYTLHSFPILSGMSFYIFSDGFIDQHGGPQRKTFGTARFKELMLKNSCKSPDEQKNSLAEEIDRWKGNTKQTDDMLVIGGRIN